jgi:hypothetical protein
MTGNDFAAGITGWLGVLLCLAVGAAAVVFGIGVLVGMWLA